MFKAKMAQGVAIPLKRKAFTNGGSCLGGMVPMTGVFLNMYFDAAGELSPVAELVRKEQRADGQAEKAKVLGKVQLEIIFEAEAGVVGFKTEAGVVLKILRVVGGEPNAGGVVESAVFVLPEALTELARSVPGDTRKPNAVLPGAVPSTRLAVKQVAAAQVAAGTEGDEDGELVPF